MLCRRLAGGALALFGVVVSLVAATLAFYAPSVPADVPIEGKLTASMILAHFSVVAISFVLFGIYFFKHGRRWSGQVSDPSRPFLLLVLASFPFIIAANYFHQVAFQSVGLPAVMAVAVLLAPMVYAREQRTGGPVKLSGKSRALLFLLGLALLLVWYHLPSGI